MLEFAKMSELMGCALLLFGEGLTVSHANARAAEILGIPSESLIGLPLEGIDRLFLDRQGRPLPGGRAPLHLAVSRKERLLDAEFTLPQKGAPPQRISLNASPLFDEAGGIHGLVVDFTRCCRSEERLHQFIGAMDEIVFEFDAEGRYLNVWSENEELLKVPGRELYGRRFEEFIPRELAEALFEVFREVRATGEPKSLEYPLDVLGGRRWFLARVALVPSPDGEPTFSFLARDITAIKELDQALRESESRFRGLFENAASGIALVTPDGRCLDANRCLCEILGYSAQELREIPFSSYSHPDDLGRDLEQFERIMRGEIDSYGMEKRFFRKDGRQIWGYMTVALQRDQKGAPLYTIAVVEDITRRKGIEAEKERLLAELEAIFASAGDGIIFYDEKGGILRLNEAAREILGYSEAQVRASLLERYRNWGPTRPDGTAIPLAESPLFRAFQGEPAKNTMAHVRRPDGKQVWISFSASPVFGSSGRQTGAVATLTDITHQRELQERLEDYLHMLAHDLRSPLTVISGHAELLRNRLAGDEEALESARTIIEAAEHANAMMEDLVEVGRLESAQGGAHPDLVRLDEFVGDFLRQHLSHEYRRVRADLHKDLPRVRVGKDHLTRILENLIGNALKYSPAECPVEIGGASEGGKVCLTVRDYGEGIVPEDLTRIFERFYRSASVRDQACGTGMGLYIARKLLESYGGSIRVESEMHRGSAFTFCLPAAQDT